MNLENSVRLCNKESKMSSIMSNVIQIPMMPLQLKLKHTPHYYQPLLMQLKPNCIFYPSDCLKIQSSTVTSLIHWWMACQKIWMLFKLNSDSCRLIDDTVPTFVLYFVILMVFKKRSDYLLSSNLLMNWGVWAAY